jgi:hypothetical protein
MGYVSKINPIGIDIVINNIIESMYGELINAGWTDYNAYHRVYKNVKDDTGTFVPEAYTSNSRDQHDYQEVLMNDNNKKNTSFFLTGDSTEHENGNFKVPLSIIFQLNSQELYKTLVSRADEESRNDAMVAIQNSIVNNKITSMVTSIPVVYAEFNTDNVIFTDMSPMHVFRINLDVIVNYDCDYYCTHKEGTGGYEILN